MTHVNVPDWFKIDRYTYSPLTDEAQVKEAALAVLDRAPLFQTVAHPGFDPATVGAAATEGALKVLRHWSADPYCRPDRHALEKLRAALQPVSEAEIRVFEDVLAREEKAEEKEAQEAEEQKAREEAAKWCRVWEEVRHLPAGERWQGAIDLAEQWGRKEGPSAPSWVDELLKPAPPARAGKLLEYRIAAYLDWALYLALFSESPTPSVMRQMHYLLWNGEEDGPDWRTIDDFLEWLEGADHLRLRARIEKGGISAAWTKNIKRRD